MKELKNRGQIKKTTRVDGFILGDQIESGENGKNTYDDNQVTIIPMLYETILKRAEKRLLDLHSKVKEAPFLLEQQEQLIKFIEPLPFKQSQVPMELL